MITILITILKQFITWIKLVYRWSLNHQKTLDLTLEHFNNKNTPKDNLSKTERTTLNKLKKTKRHHNQKGQQRGHHCSRDHRKIHRRWTQTSKQPNSLPTHQQGYKPRDHRGDQLTSNRHP